MQTENKKREVPKQLQNELYDKVEPYIERIIAAYEKEGLGFSRFSLKSIGMQCAAIGYYHESDKAQPQDTTLVPIELFNEKEIVDLLEGLHPYLHDYQADNITDTSVGLHEDKEFTSLYEKVVNIISKAKTKAL